MAFAIHAAGQFFANAFQSPAVKILIEIIGGGFELGRSQIVFQRQQAVAHHPGGGDQHGQHARMSQPREVNVFQQFPVGGSDGNAQADAHAAGKQRQNVRGASEEVGSTGNAVEALFNLFLGGLRQRLARRRFAAKQLLDVITKGLCGRNSAGGGVRLLQVAGFRQVRHHVADGGRAHAFTILLACDGLRRDRIPGGNVVFDNGGQDQVFARSHGELRRLAGGMIAACAHRLPMTGSIPYCDCRNKPARSQDVICAGRPRVVSRELICELVFVAMKSKGD